MFLATLIRINLSAKIIAIKIISLLLKYYKDLFCPYTQCKSLYLRNLSNIFYKYFKKYQAFFSL